jgi:hypothetical protein
MRGENRQGRFNIPHERDSIISGTTTEMVNTVGNVIQWWFYDETNTLVDPIYDTGDNTNGGRLWIGPTLVPVINTSIMQGMTAQNDRGFYNTDILKITINIDMVEDHRRHYGKSASTYPNLTQMEINPDVYIRDRVVFRNEVWTPTQVSPLGLVTDRYTVMSITCNQVNSEELVNDPQFQQYANYSYFDRTVVPDQNAL